VGRFAPYSIEAAHPSISAAPRNRTRARALAASLMFSLSLGIVDFVAPISFDEVF